jgi:anaerobic dimethyl sulfoxide reductase, A subunit, DmsA/YnfE family
MNANAESSHAERIVLSSGAHNCGGRCLLRLHVSGGRIVRISSDEERPDSPSSPQLRACLRCRSYRERLYHPDRLLYPMRRSGERGEGKFERITWDDALGEIAEAERRLRERYGPDALFVQYATGNEAMLAEPTWMRRLLGLAGGYLGYYNSYSTACASNATPYVYGTNDSGSSRETWQKSKLIILSGFNPAETIHGTNTAYYLRLAKEAGARIVAIDPMYTSTAVALADQWIPIRPTTDNALFDAMAYVMLSEGLQDQAFLDRHCLGFDEEHMPQGYPAGLSYASYVLGRSSDGIAKTPAWAEPITGVPARVIAGLAREFAAAKPAALIQGYGPQRHAYGEQFDRGGPCLAAMTGNVGVLGGWAGGTGYQARRAYVAQLPKDNPNPARIPVYTWPDAIARPESLTPETGLRGADRLGSGIKMIFNLGGNCLVNQHTDSNGAAAILSDESLVESIVVSEQFMTSSARFADILLPADMMYERDDIIEPWEWGDYLLFMNKAVDPPGECRNGYDWIADLAGMLGLGAVFTEGLSQELWLRRIVAETSARNPGFPSFEEFREKALHEWHYDAPCVAFKDQIDDPEGHPFPTSSGKIEIFSPALYAMNRPAEVPAIPKYIPAWEGPEDELVSRFPLQCIGHHTKRRAHSTFDNSPSMESVEPQALWINPEDAAARGLADGALARVWNDRGAVELCARITLRIMPGVVSMPQGGWWEPDAAGTDRRGCVNVLGRYKPTPLARGNPSHTMLVEVARA